VVAALSFIKLLSFACRYTINLLCIALSDYNTTMRLFIYILMSISAVACSVVKHTSHTATGFNNNPVVAHRGAWENAKHPQNSIASLKEAIQLDCAGSEFDVHMTADDSLVICHDDTYAGMVIEKSSFAQLAAKPLPNGERIPTLQEYLTAGMSQQKTRLVLEIKKSIISPGRTLQLTERCVQLVKQLRAQQWIVYISFDYPACKKIRALDEQANIQYLEGDQPPAQLKADKINGLDYHYSVFKKHPEWITEARRLGLDLNTWTVNTEADLQFFLQQKFNFITTNQPELLFKLLGK
jgi:glycerophosphoryl diester phosphodiesterase